MVYLYVRHQIQDYVVWRPAFDAHEDARRAAGATGRNHVFRSVNDPNDITIILEWDTAENAGRFMQDPRLAEVMQAAGVVSAPEARFLQAV